jgi:hypothetical protein
MYDSIAQKKRIVVCNSIECDNAPIQCMIPSRKKTVFTLCGDIKNKMSDSFILKRTLHTYSLILIMNINTN